LQIFVDLLSRIHFCYLRNLTLLKCYVYNIVHSKNAGLFL